MDRTVIAGPLCRDTGCSQCNKDLPGGYIMSCDQRGALLLGVRCALPVLVSAIVSGYNTVWGKASLACHQWIVTPRPLPGVNLVAIPFFVISLPLARNPIPSVKMSVRC